jgi:hydroxymethylpyrimidine/phosphomethylpyrimidine kinase
MIPNILSIAGSDPSGGAGIQADLKTIAANGGYGMAALTALTVQNTRGVSDAMLIPPAVIAAQIASVFADIEVHAVKIGMIGDAGIARSVAGALIAAGARAIVLDPVMVAKGGDRLLAAEAVGALVRHLLPISALITPNLPEAGDLLGRPAPETRAQMEVAAADLRALGARAVLLKGGHLGGADSPDYLLSDAGGVWLTGPRHATRNTHGTGCTLSSALATRLGRGDTLEAAARAAKIYVAGAIARAGALRVGGGHGPLHHFHALDGVIS